MDDGIFSLLFFGVLILASVFDAMTRGRRRRRRMEEMEREEDVEERVEPVGTAERETADSMVPSDLWAILTGEQPVPGSESAQTPASGPSAEPDQQREAERVLPQSEVILEPSSDVEPEWVPESGEASKPEPVPELSPPQSRGAPLPLPERSYRSTEAPPVETAPSEIGVSKRSQTPMPGLIGVARARRPGGAAVYAELLRGGGDSLRRAIVLTEVLGEPASVRPPGWGWEER